MHSEYCFVISHILTHILHFIWRLLLVVKGAVFCYVWLLKLLFRIYWERKKIKLCVSVSIFSVLFFFNVFL